MGFTAFKSFKLEKGLYLEERKGALNYKARASISGHTFFENTESVDFTRAERVARSWFRQEQREVRGIASGADTDMHTAARAFLDTLEDRNLRKYHETKWQVVRRLLG